jgi:hypothetical protein
MMRIRTKSDCSRLCTAIERRALPPEKPQMGISPGGEEAEARRRRRGGGGEEAEARRRRRGGGGEEAEARRRRRRSGGNESMALCSPRLCARHFLFPQGKKPRNPGSSQFGENQTDFLTSSAFFRHSQHGGARKAEPQDLRRGEISLASPQFGVPRIQRHFNHTRKRDACVGRFVLHTRRELCYFPIIVARGAKELRRKETLGQ